MENRFAIIGAVVVGAIAGTVLGKKVVDFVVNPIRKLIKK